MATPSKPPTVNPQAPSETATLPPSVPGKAVTLPPPAPSDTATLAPTGSAAAGGIAVAVPGYEIVRELGRGGMGVVYQARQTKLNRPVALKMILAGSHAGTADLARFQTEAEAIARLRHSNIVQVYEVGEHEGKPYFSLEFCGGGSLEKKLGGTPQPPGEAAALVETLARAMQAAHEKGVIHRDLKPANVLLAGDGTPKVTDFGLAKKLDEAGQTASGAVMGTPSYMAPEQAEGRAVGPLADVYALGAILYECLTGRPPFKAATALDTMMQVMSDEPVPPSRLAGKLPADLETISLKCLSKEPARRYASAEELANDLRRFQAGEPIRATGRGGGAGVEVARPGRRLAALLAWCCWALMSLAVLSGNLMVLSGNLVAARNDANEKRQAAEKDADKARKSRDFLVNIFRIKDIKAGNTTTARHILNEAEQRIPVEFAEQPELRDELLAAIEDVNRNLDGTIPAAMILEARAPSGPVPPRRRAAPAGAADAAQSRRPPDRGRGRSSAARDPVRPAQGAAATGPGGYHRPQGLFTA